MSTVIKIFWNVTPCSLLSKILHRVTFQKNVTLTLWLSYEPAEQLKVTTLCVAEKKNEKTVKKSIRYTFHRPLQYRKL